MQRSTIRRVGRRLVLPLWLPLSILVVTAIRVATLSPGQEASGMPNAAAMIALMVLFAWIAAIPLTLAVTYLHRRVRVVAYVCGAVLVPLTVYGAVFGGVFGPVGGVFGPVGVALYPLVLSLPAWIALGITTFIQRNRSDMRSAASA